VSVIKRDTPTDFVRALRLLSRREQRKLGLVAFVQVLFGLLDLAGVAFIGMLTALAIRGVQSQGAGDRVSQALEMLNLQDFDIRSQIFILGALSVLAFTFKTIFSVIFLRKTLRYLSRKAAEISSDLFGRLLTLPIERISLQSRQQRLYAITTGVTNISVGVLTSAVLIVADASLLIVLIIGLLILDPVICTVTVVIFSMIGFSLYYLLHSRAQGLGKEFSSTAIKSNQDMIEAMEAYRELFVRGALPHYSNRIRKLRNTLAVYDAEIKFLPNVSKYVTELAIVIGALAVCSILFSMNDSSRAVAVLAVFMAASTRIAPAVMRLQQGAITIKSNLSTAKSTLDLADELLGVEVMGTKENHFVTDHLDFEAEVKLENVTFSYITANKPAIANFSLEVKAGQMIALVGPSGGGKSTLVDLILGISKAQQGCISISGQDPSIALTKWPGAVGFVSQNVFIANGTIKENILLGYESQEIEEDLIWRALAQVELTDLVLELPGKINFNVGEGGSNLSGGQRQRLGIARALITKPQLLILDEATSNLDSETERKLSEAILKLKGNQTLIVIAHRLSTIREADRVIYIQDGEMRGEGTFNELRETNQQFAVDARNMGL
jgi:ATP-binding cassette, subfamily B, bacterial PglK